jgi:hypothetical protein
MGGADRPIFETDFFGPTPAITVGGTTLQRFTTEFGTPGTARQATIDNEYNVFAKLVTGRDDAVFSELEPADKTKARILASLANPEFEKRAREFVLKSVAPGYIDKYIGASPRYGLPHDPDWFTITMYTMDKTGDIDIRKNSNGDFVIRGNASIPASEAIFNRMHIPLNPTLSSMSAAFTLTISREEMDRLSLLDWTREGSLSREYQTAFSEHEVAGELRLFRAE